MTLEIDTAAVEAAGTEAFPAVASVYDTSGVLVQSMQEDYAPVGLFNSGFLATWVDYSTQLTLYLKQSEANLEVCGEMLAAMAREMAAVDVEGRDEIEAYYRDDISNPEAGSYQEAADLE